MASTPTQFMRNFLFLQVFKCTASVFSTRKAVLGSDFLSKVRKKEF